MPFVFEQEIEQPKERFVFEDPEPAFEDPRLYGIPEGAGEPISTITGKPLLTDFGKPKKADVPSGRFVFEEPEEADFIERVKSSWKTGVAQTELGQLRYRQLLGEDTDEINQQIADLKIGMPSPDKIKRGLPERAIKAAAEMLPIQVAGMKKGAKRGLKMGLGFAGVTAIAGQAGPQVALPEEIVTVPAAFAGGYGVGMLSGTLENIGQIEAGLAYDELLDFKDDKGNRVDPVIAKAAAASVGVINGLIEMAQIKLLLKTIPGGEALLRGSINKTLKKAVTSKTLKAIALKHAGRYGTFIAGETGQEVLQESTNILANEIAKDVTNELRGTDLPATTIQEIGNRLVDTAKQSALAFSVMGIPGTVVSGGIEAGKRKATEPTIPTTPETDQQTTLTNIKAALESGEITTDDVANYARSPEAQEDGIADDLNALIAEAKEIAKPPDVAPSAKDILTEGEDVTAKELLTGKALTDEERIEERAKTLEEAPKKPAEISAEAFERKITEEERVKAKAEIEPDLNKFFKRAKEIPITPKQKDLLRGLTKEQAQKIAVQWNEIWKAGTETAKQARITEAETFVRERPDLFNLVHGLLMVKPTPAEPKTDVALEPVGVEIPDFKTTGEAYAFGEKATPEQVKELQRLVKVQDTKFNELKKAGKLQEAMDEAIKHQFYNEALQKVEGTEQYKKFKPEPKEVPETGTETEKVEVTPEKKEAWEMTPKEWTQESLQPTIEKMKIGETKVLPDKRIIVKSSQDLTYGETYISRSPVKTKMLDPSEIDQLPDKIKNFVERYEAGEKDLPPIYVSELMVNPKTGETFREIRDGHHRYYMAEEVGLEELPAMERVSGLYPEEHEAIVRNALKKGENVPESVLAEYPKLKPLPSKPPKAKPPEAAREEIKGEVIPEVKPKVEKEKVEVTKEDIEAFIKPLHHKYYLEGQNKGIAVEKLNAYGALQINKLVGSKLRANVDMDAVKQYLKEHPTKVEVTKKAGVEVTPEAIPKELEAGIKKIEKLDAKRRKYITEYEQIVSTSGVGQAPPVAGVALNKAMEISKKQAEIWNGIRSYIVVDNKTLWQVAVSDKENIVKQIGKEEGLDFYGSDIREMIDRARKAIKPTAKEKVEVEVETTPEGKEITQEVWENLTLDEFEKIPLKERGQYELPKSVREERLETERWAEEQERKKKEAKVKRAEKKAKGIDGFRVWAENNNYKEPSMPVTAWGKPTISDSKSLQTKQKNKWKKFYAETEPKYIEYVKEKLKKGNKFKYDDIFENYADLLNKRGESSKGFELLLREYGYTKNKEGKWSKKLEKPTDVKEPAGVRDEKAFATKEPYEKDLIAYHNTTATELLAALESGGLAMPSIAITRKDIPYEKYGPITLIGRKETIDPKGDRANRVFDSDIYSPRVPGKEWNVNQKEADKVYDRFESVMDEVGIYKYNFEEAMGKGKGEFIDHADSSNALKVAFLREQNIPIQIPKRKVPFLFSFSDTKAIQEYLKSIPYMINSVGFQSKEHKELSQAVERGITEYAEDIETTKEEVESTVNLLKESYFSEEGFLNYNITGQLNSDQQTLKNKPIEVDKYKLEDRLKNKFTKKLSEEYLEWINEIADPVYGEPFIKLGRKKVPYTLGNIVKAMKREGLKGEEKTPTFGPAKARAKAAKQISSIKAMHGLKDRLVTEEKVQEAIKDQEKVQDELTKELIDHYKHKDWRGNVDVWAALDDAMKATGTFLSGQVRTISRMQDILKRHDFENVSVQLARKAVNFSKVLMDTPTQYFELKSQKAVGFDEFEGVVIPTNASLKLKRALKEAGLTIKTYKEYDTESRQKAVSFFHKKKGVLFSTTTKPQETITRKDLRKIFSRMKHIRTGQDKDGNLWFKATGRPKVAIYELDNITDHLNTSAGQIPVGSFLRNTIELKTGGEGHTADIGTAYHEFFHWLSQNGIISANDITALNRVIAKDRGISESNVTEEHRAYYVGDNISAWGTQKNPRIRRILRKLKDFMNAIYDFAAQAGWVKGRKRTAEGVLRDISSGEILAEKKIASERAGELIPAYQMAGTKAIGAPTGQLVKAQEMLAEGKDKKEVWKETGWIKMKDGWKFEIDDSGAELKIKTSLHPPLGIDTKSDVLSGILSHPELFKAYPQLRNLLTNITIGEDVKTKGELTEGQDRSAEGLKDLEPEISVYAKNMAEAKDTLLHEAQHAIQEIEGFARGGTPKTFEAIRQRDEGNLARTIGNYNKLLSKYAKEDNKEQYAAVLKVRDELTQKAIELQDYSGEKSLEDYKRLAGEIEARDTSARALLSSKHRKEIFPYEAQGIPEDQWIITKGKGTSFSVQEQKAFSVKGGKDYSAMFEKYRVKRTTPLVDELTMGEEKPSFLETLEPVTSEDYLLNRKTSKSIKLTAKTNIKRVASEIAEGVDKFLGSTSTRIGRVSLKLKAKLRKLDFDINTKYAADVKSIHSLLKKAKKMDRNDFADWDYARKNSDINKINELVNKYNMQAEYAAYRKVLDDTRKEGLDVGLVIGEIEEYAPRILKDDRGFLKEIGKPEYRPLYSDQLKKRAQDMKMSVESLPLDLKADIISNIMLGGWVGLGGIPATKHRVLQKIPANLNKYYMHSDAALMQHLYSMRKGIEARKFFGEIPKKVKEIRKRLYHVQSQIRELSKSLKGKLSETELAKIKKQRNKYISLEKQYMAYIQKYALQRDYTENIGAYIVELIEKKEIDAKHERIVNDMLKARFHEVGTRGVIQMYKNLSYIDTMGSPISALTQIGDMAWAMYEGGLIRSLKYAYKAAVKKSRITKEDVGVERIAQEFADSGTLGDAVSKVFKIVGLEKIDSIGKEALLNTALEKYQKRAKKEPLKFKKELKPIFGIETNSVIEDLVNDEISENVKLLVYSRLLDFQPVALSEMPQRYLDAGNGRLFYMLKTFTLKVFDVFRNESYNKIRYGNKADKIQGMKNFVRLSLFFVLANAGADELKDWVLGRKTDFEDRIVDNVLRLCGVSKFVTWKARTEGVGSALARQILPPFKFIDSAGKDIITAGDEKGLEVIGSIPVVGKLAYWHIGRGTSKREDLWNRRLRKQKTKLNKIKDGLEKTKNKMDYRRKHRLELRKLRQANELQGQLNDYRKRINRLKSMKEIPARKRRIQMLEVSRTELIKKFLSKN